MRGNKGPDNTIGIYFLPLNRLAIDMGKTDQPIEIMERFCLPLHGEGHKVSPAGSLRDEIGQRIPRPHFEYHITVIA